ncbi:trichohyalin-like isoform X2 [Rhinatrema bivittatum]|nr:trichohyalin-like isoform X2 [Rhinatrema bivittatum]XP_029434159.1 trichohyalin-like isoform X2 [Rhinatrema bivittatum]
MTEGEVDESSLHGVQEVCRDFAVLEDGALAHCLQEQEIEQHYASNIQKNKLVQKDIRIAKKLQDEEDHQSKLQSLQKQKQIEERDLAYAHAIQEELRRKAEECQQREEDDQEVARKLQELEEVELQGRRRSLDGHSRRREHGRFHHRQPHPRETHSEEEEEEENCLYRRESNCIPNETAARRNPRKAEQGRGWKDSNGQFTNTSFFRGSNSRQDTFRERQPHPLYHEDFRSEPRRDRSRGLREAWHGGQGPFPEDIGHGRAQREREESEHGPWEGKKHPSNRGDRESFHRPQHGGRRCSDSDGELSPERELRGRSRRYSQRSQGREQGTHPIPIKCPPKRHSRVSQSGGSARHCRDGDRLEWHLSELQLQNCDQVLRDEELARRLQEEEEKEMATLTPQGHNEDFRAAQVAQDEEIAKYMQHQELRAHQRSRETEPRRKNSGEQSSVFERWRHADAKAEVAVSHPERLNSDGLASPTEEHLPERSDPATEGAKHLLSRNIAEALDPTFKSSPQEPSASTAGVRSQECSVSARPCALPVDGFYDFMDEGSETVFVPPTKRQLDKSGQQKSRDKKEGCKQQ